MATERKTPVCKLLSQYCLNYGQYWTNKFFQLFGGEWDRRVSLYEVMLTCAIVSCEYMQGIPVG